MQLSDFDYILPEELIAQDPILDRKASRLLVLKRGFAPEHRHFFNIGEYLNPGDCLVLNDTKVMLSRLLGKKEKTGGAAEVLLLKRLGKNIWEAALKPSKRLPPGSRIIFGEKLSAEVLDAGTDGIGKIEFFYDGVFESVLEETGEMPLPHYIKKKPRDINRYQTVYARVPGAAAAPTAGLHFTPALLDELREGGIKTVFITLHVGIGTFRPVKTDDITKHKMHSESYHISAESAGAINECRKRGGRVVCVGTTSCRALESAAGGGGEISAGFGDTDIFIYPGYKFKCTDALITNFHLPKSTLLMLVCAFAERDEVLSAYREAISREYRFFSFGDAMLIY